MITNWVSDIVGSAIEAVAALPLKEVAATYLAVSLLGPLCWIGAIELVRFVRRTKKASELRTAPAAALSIATRRQPATPGLLDSPLSEN